MATYYVSKAGNDSNAGTAKSAPKLTIASAISSVTHGDTVEILDQGTYAEDDLSINYNGLTFTHTASELGRAKINAGGNSHAFEFSNVTGTVFRGLEIYNCSNYALHNNSQAQRTFHITGCFFHDINKLTFKAIEGNGTSGPNAREPATIFESIIYGDNQGNFSAPILVDGRLYIRNSFITASTDGYVIKNYAGTNTTASFSTFINRHASTTYPVVQATKVINCIVSGSSSNLKGLACDNGSHTYNLVNVGGTNFRNLADNANGSTGTGEITGQMPIFIDGGAIGNSANIVGNYNLQSSSPAIGAGAAYNSINIDISGTTRPQGAAFDIGCFEYISSSPAWTDYGTQPDPNFSGEFTINTYNNLTSNYKLSNSENPGQVPFSLGAAGPATIRQRSTAYSVTKGDDPSKAIT
tara:strand:- start:91 stop:1323 length:1233 start_codon:yes stop_codon:yes gene_type:complete